MNLLKHIAIDNRKRLACLEVFIKQNDERIYHYLEVKRKVKDQISICHDFTCRDIEQLKQLWNKYTPTILLLNGKGILIKTVSHERQDTPESLLQKSIPSADPSHFHIRQHQSSDTNEAFISMARRDLLNSIINDFYNINLFFIACYWGPFDIESLIPLLNASSELVTGNYTFRFKNGYICGFQASSIGASEETKYIIGDEEIKGISMLSLGCIINHLKKKDISNENFPEALHRSEKEFIYSRILSAGSKVAVLSFFILLLTNFLLFTHYRKEYDHLQLINNNPDYSENNIDTLNKLFETKFHLLEESGFTTAELNSFYADSIASTVGDGIILTTLDINPSAFDDDKGYSFNPGVINISGISQNSLVLNKWMKQLGSFKWISTITLESFSREEAAEDSEFSLKLVLQKG